MATEEFWASKALGELAQSNNPLIGELTLRFCFPWLSGRDQALLELGVLVGRALSHPESGIIPMLDELIYRHACNNLTS